MTPEVAALKKDLTERFNRLDRERKRAGEQYILEHGLGRNVDTTRVAEINTKKNEIQQIINLIDRKYG